LVQQNLTQKDIKYFKENGTYPERYNQVVFESSKGLVTQSEALKLKIGGVLVCVIS
jgi:ribosomal protein S8